jgi:alpha-tubulin suppressor-like RCC1 family protein
VKGLPGAATRTSPGYGHTCALLRTRQIYCWGNNHDGQCGVPPSEPISVPVLVPLPGIRVVNFLSGDKHTCAVTEDNDVYCWGNTEYGQCGIDPVLTGRRRVGPTKVPNLDSVLSLTMVKDHTCAVRSKPPAFVCWGSNSHVEPPEGPFVNGKLGPAARDLAYSAAPVPVDLGAVTAARAGAEATYAVVESGIYAWGENGSAQLGVESRERIMRTPAPVMRESGAGLVPLRGALTMIGSGGLDQCAMMADGAEFGAQFVCWGTDEWGELGIGTEADARRMHRYPRPVRALPSQSLTRGEDHACGPVYRGGRAEIWCYGRPGALGNGTERANDAELPSQWLGTPVIWKPENFAPALHGAEVDE